ncbi:MAG: FAD binding domain-containing protein [Chloroflexi bacterium]|nr:FAD binding domain-containing protein [Chloroflexota bacterium]
MPTRSREYHRPTDLPDALKLLRRRDVRTIPLVVGPKPPPNPYAEAEAVVDLSRLNLAYVNPTDNGIIHIGAMTPLQDLIDSPLLSSQANGLLPHATQHVAHYGLRHLATVGGAVLSREGPPEVLLALLALDAIVALRGNGRRGMALPDFLAADAAPGEMVAEVNFRRLPETKVGGALERVARTPRDEAIVAAVAVVELADGGACRSARVAVAGAGLRPFRATSAEKLLEGQLLDDDLLRRAAESVRSASSPVGDYRGSADYRREMAAVLAQRALTRAWERAK